MKIVILDSESFFGKHLTKLLQKSKHLVVPLSKKKGLNMMNFLSVKKWLEKTQPDVIYNCAAHIGGVHYVSKFAADVINDNLQMILNTYKAVCKVCPAVKIISPLSNCSYPGEANIHLESDWLMGPVHESVYAYGNAKRLLHVVSHCYKKQHGIQSYNFLIPNHFGPEDEIDPTKIHALPGMIVRMIQALKNNFAEFEIWGTGKPTREWGYGPDIAKVLIQAMNLKEDLTYPVNIAQNKGYSIMQSAKLIAKEIGYKGKLIFNTSYQDGALIKVLDDKKFRKLFPKFKFTDHQLAIRETVKYYQPILA